MRIALSDLFSQVWCLLAWLQEQGAATPPETVAPTGAEEGAPPSFLTFFLDPINLLLISGFLFVFLVLRPQQKQMKELQKSLETLKKNDRIITNSGIHGTIIQTNSGDSTVVLRIDDNSGARMTVNRDAISKILVEEEKAEGKG